MASDLEVISLVVTGVAALLVSLSFALLIERRARRREYALLSKVTDSGYAREKIREQVDLILGGEKDMKATFLLSIVDIERRLRELSEASPNDKGLRNVSLIVNKLIERGILEEKWGNSFKSLWDIRNRIIHGMSVSETEIRYGADLAASLIMDLKRTEIGQRHELGLSKFEILRDAAGNFRWRLKASNGEIIATSEAYESKAACKNGMELVRKSSPDAIVEDMSE